MKIGRNEPCPCGSGKKFKKCCIDKPVKKYSNDITVPIEKSISEFPYINDAAKKLESIISKFSIDDVIKAAFCINSWANNRSAIVRTLTLNQAICNSEAFGDRTIKEYAELKSFFEEITPYLKTNNNEDLTLNDFGQVKMIVKGETYPVILGTGHESVYAVMRLLPTLAETIKMTDELEIILNYNSMIINTLCKSNIRDSDEEYDITFELPSEQFWQEVNNLFGLKEFTTLKEEVFDVMGYQICPIEMRHFMLHMGEKYPLYNTSLLVDLYKKFLSIATEEEYHRHINTTIGHFIENTFNLSKNTNSRVLVAPRIINITTGKVFTENNIQFVTNCGDRVLIAINKRDFETDGSLQNTINLIRSLKDSDQLRLVEGLYRRELNGGYALDVLSHMMIQFLFIDPQTDITSHGFVLGSSGDEFSCSVLDLMYIMIAMENFDELLDFIEYYINEKATIIGIGGKSNLFITWKNSHHHIASGAIEYNLISTSYGTSDDYIYEFFTKKLMNYPFGINSKMFADPFNWKVREGDFGYTHFEHKGCQGFGGEGRIIGALTFLFLVHNIEFFIEEDLFSENLTALRIIDELNQRMFNRYGGTLAQFPLLSGKVIQLMYMPMHYAIKVDKTGFTKEKNKRYVYSDMLVDVDTVIMRYTVNFDELISNIMDSNDKSVECAYFLELLEPLRKLLQTSFTRLEEIVNEDSSMKKEVGVFTVEQDYYYSDKAPNFQMEAQNFIKARKHIAGSCFAEGVEPGEYKGKVATQVIRRMQTAIVNAYEEQISQYNKEELHKKALSYYSSQLHGLIINLKRYATFSDLDEMVQKEFEEKTRYTRETQRRNLRTAQYLLESNLAVRRFRGCLAVTKNDEFKDLLAFADWLVSLQDNSDTCHFTDSDVSISVDSEYKVDTILSEFSELQYEQMIFRKYNQEDYRIKSDEKDKEFLKRSMNSFLEDTGVEIDIVISILEYLQLKVVDKTFVEQVYPNVFESTKDDLINDFLKYIDESKEVYKEKVVKALDFITLDCDKLKCLNGETHNILPIWNRERRDNRFDVKPMIILDEKCTFSPVVMKQLATTWKSSFIEWNLPFEVGLESVKLELAKWKKRYEDQMVQDIANEFIRIGFDPVFAEIELASRYPKCSFPKDLGDYDVIAVNQHKKEIWIIESKVIQKVGAIYEDQMQQKSFFYQHKYDEKFQRRIDYMVKNLREVVSALDLEDSEYKVIPYMVTNKLLTSRYKEVGFKIISYHEFVSILENIDTETIYF